jgi:hypothetical protein
MEIPARRMAPRASCPAGQSLGPQAPPPVPSVEVVALGTTREFDQGPPGVVADSAARSGGELVDEQIGASLEADHLIGREG